LWLLNLDPSLPLTAQEELMLCRLDPKELPEELRRRCEPYIDFGEEESPPPQSPAAA
jgi:hypothetical protein